MENREETKRHVIDPFLDEYEIRDKYNYLASDRLKELLDRYFRMTDVDIRMEHGRSDDKWKALIDEIRETIKADFEDLKKQYYELVREQT